MAQRESKEKQMAIDIYSGASSTPTPVFGAGYVKIFGKSLTWTVPTGVTSVKVHCWGAGGGGGLTNQQYPYATGGGGGGYAMKTVSVTPGSTYALTVGAGGEGGYYSTNNGVFYQGFAGGTTSFGSELSATGGGGGIGQNVSYLGGSGGSGNGGEINFSGGAGGGFPNSYRQWGAAATGGGAAGGPWGDGGRGGHFYGWGTNNGGYGFGTGGGGTGGNGGDIVVESNAGSSNLFTGGGGSHGPARVLRINNNYSLSNEFGQAGVGATVVNKKGFGRNNMATTSASNTNAETYGATAPDGDTGTIALASRYPGEYLDGAGGNPSYISNPALGLSNPQSYAGRGGGCGGQGAGGGAIMTEVTSTFIDVTAGHGGIFGGGGSITQPSYSYSQYHGRAGNGGIAGGGGGAAGYSNNNYMFAGNGGNGLIVLEY